MNVKSLNHLQGSRYPGKINNDLLQFMQTSKIAQVTNYSLNTMKQK